MNHRSHLREFLKYASLNIIGMLGISFYILADTFFIARGLGANGLAALNLAIPVYSFIHGCGLMLGMGGATRYSIYMSQGRPKNADIVFTNTIYLACIFALCFFVTGLFLSSPVTALLGADEAIFDMTNIYLKIILLFSPAFIMNEVLLGFVRNNGNPGLSMLAMIGGSLVNIVFDYILIFPCGLGIFGAVLATGFSPLCSLLILSTLKIKKKNQFHLTRTNLDFQTLRAVVSLGFPSLVTEVSSGIVMIIFNFIILSLSGNIGVAAYGVIANLVIVVLAIFTGISQGIQPLISRSYGGRNFQQAKYFFRCGVCTVILISAGIYLGIFFFASPVTAIFNSEHDPILQQVAEVGLRLYFTGIVFAGLNMILSIYFTSVEKPLPAHIISILRGFLFIIPLAFLLSALWGLTGVWFAFPAAESLVAVLGSIMYIIFSPPNRIAK